MNGKVQTRGSHSHSDYYHSALCGRRFMYITVLSLLVLSLVKLQTDINELHVESGAEGQGQGHENAYHTRHTSLSSTTTRSGAKCLAFEDTFDDLVASSSNVLVTMPAKAAGTSMKSFTKSCVGSIGGDNVLNSKAETKKVLHDQLSPPKIVTSHIYTDDIFVKLFKNVPRRSLVVYLHRNENDRFVSAVKHIVETRICTEGIPEAVAAAATKDGNKCVVGEGDLIQQVIVPKIDEIRVGPSNLLTCRSYRAMEDGLPTLVFVHYKQAAKLQNVLAKYFCPDMIDKEVRLNISEMKPVEAFVKLESGQEVDLNEWLEAKRDLLEYTYGLREEDAEKMTCQSMTRNMEDDLLSCGDKVLALTRDTSFRI